MIDSSDCDNYSSFLDAIRNHDENSVQILVQKGIFLKKDSCNSELICPLELAISLKNLSIVRILLQHGACISAKIRSFNETALHYAVITRQKAMLMELLRQGVNWRNCDEKGAGVLHMLFELGHVNFEQRKSNGMLQRKTCNISVLERKLVDILQIFVSLGVDVNARSNSGETPLHLALREGMVEVAEYLLSNGANIDVRDCEGNSLIHLLIEDEHRAMQKRHRDNETTIDWLLMKGASVNLVNAAGRTPVQLAIEYRLKAVLLILLDYIELGYVNSRGETWLHSFLQLGTESDCLSPMDLEAICEDLLDAGVPVDPPDCYGSTALHLATLQRRPRLVAKMLPYFGNVTACDGLGRTVLHLLVDRCLDERGRAIEGYDEAVRQLISKGADIGRQSRDGSTPVQLAAKHRQLRMLWIFKEHGADFAQRSAGGEGLLHALAKSRPPARPDSDADADLADKMTAEMLISQGCEVNARSRSGHSPLHLACLYGNGRVAESLLKHGAALDAREDLAHWAPIHLAACAPVLEVLARRGADLQLRDKLGRTSLHLAVERSRTDLVETLLRLGADPRARDDSRRRLTPIHLAAQRSDEPLLRLLLTAAPDSVDLATAGCGRTALHMAAEAGSLQLARCLLQLGADPERRDTRERATPLHLAVRAGATKLVEHLLLETGVDVNARQAFGETALHVAMKYYARGGAELARCLLRAGASVEMGSLQGRTPLQYAVEYDCSEGVQLLLQFGADPSEAFADDLFGRMSANCDMACHVVEHLVKCELLDRHLHPLGGQSQRLQQFQRLREDCRDEVERLKAHKLDGQYSLYQLLHLGPKRRYVCINASGFTPEHVEEQYPKYSGLLWRAYHEALERKSLLATALELWYLLTDYYLPSVCLDHLLGYLDNDSLKSLIEAAEAIELEEIC